MTWDSPKSSPTLYPNLRPLSWVVVFLGILAFFLFCASGILASYPVGSTVREYFYGSSKFYDLSVSPENETSIDDVTSNESLDLVDDEPSSDHDPYTDSPVLSSDSNIEEDIVNESDSQVRSTESASPEFPETKEENDIAPSDSAASSSQEPVTSFGNNTDDVNSSLPALSNSQINLNSTAFLPIAGSGTDPSNVTGNITIEEPTSAALMKNSSTLIPSSSETSQLPSDSFSTSVPAPSGKPNNQSFPDSVNSGCDLFHGNWVYDPLGPLYTDQCHELTQKHNCQSNGRPDKDYENWRWKPFHCDIPRFDPRKFLELMRGKTLAFIGDSLARNQMESLMCMLLQVEKPKNHGNRDILRYFFRSTSFNIVRIWSPWLVKHNSEAFDYAPKGVDKIFVDAPDETLMKYLPTFDVVVLSSGHWFAKQSVYILNNEIVGGQLWWPDNSKPMKINNVAAFAISVEKMFTALVTHPNYSGLSILRSYSPDHYEGGAWNTGGSCTGKVKPLAVGEVVENNITNTMYEQQVTCFNRAMKKATNRSKLRFMDVTEAFKYRHDGHPGPYRNQDPNKITERGPDGSPPPQDCLHWCMPGPVDTWNEILFEILKREYEGDNAS